MRPWSRMQRERRLEVIAADVVEIHVDAVGRRLRPAAGAGSTPHVLVVDRGVEPELLGQHPHFFGGPGAADDEAAAQLGELAGDAADGAGSAGDEHTIARP